MREYLTLKQLRTFTTEKIERLQNARFKATCRYMLPNTPFYSKLFKEHGVDPFKLTTIEDWHKYGLPLIKKSTYMKNPREFIVSPDLNTIGKNHFLYLDNQSEYAEAIHYAITNKKQLLKEYYTPHSLIFSGGTESGNPVPVMLTKAQQKILQGILQIIGSIVLDKFNGQTIGMNLFPYAPHLGWHAVHQALDINADVNLNTAAGGAMPTERLITLADKMQPNIICGMSDYLRNRWLPLAIQRKIKLPETVLFVNGAQKMYDAERTKIKELANKLGVKNPIVLDLYGASELKEALLPECQPGSGYHHIAPLSTIIKTVNVERTNDELITEWNFSPNGYAASWNIDGAGTLLQGYLIGDKFDTVTNNKCANCGLNTTRINGINRIKEIEAQLKITGTIEEKIKGTRINLANIRATALTTPGVQEAQVYLDRKKKQLELRIIGTSQAKKQLEKHFAQAEIKPKIKLTTLEKLTSGKIKFEGIIVI